MTCGRQGGQGRIDDITRKGLRTAVALFGAAGGAGNTIFEVGFEFTLCYSTLDLLGASGLFSGGDALLIRGQSCTLVPIGDAAS